MGSNKRWEKLMSAYELLLRGLTLGDANKVSVVNFESTAHLAFTSLPPTEALERKLRFYQGGTDFKNAFVQLNLILKKVDQTMKQIVIFMSDGDAGYPTPQVQEMNVLKENFPSFTFFSVGIEVSTKDKLTKMAKDLGGDYIDVKEAEELVKKLLDILAK